MLLSKYDALLFMSPVLHKTKCSTI